MHIPKYIFSLLSHYKLMCTVKLGASTYGSGPCDCCSVGNLRFWLLVGERSFALFLGAFLTGGYSSFHLAPPFFLSFLVLGMKEQLIYAVHHHAILATSIRLVPD